MNVKVVGDPAQFAGESEHSQQVALFAAVAQYREAVPELRLLHAIPNGGARGTDARGGDRTAMIRGANMKAEGVRAGVYDIHLPVARHGYHSFYLEMKKPGTIRYDEHGGIRKGRDGIKLLDGRSDEQVEFGAMIEAEGNCHGVFDTWQGAFKALMWYLSFRHEKEWTID
jgi:hypothetical protein